MDENYIEKLHEHANFCVEMTNTIGGEANSTLVKLNSAAIFACLVFVNNNHETVGIEIIRPFVLGLTLILLVYACNFFRFSKLSSVAKQLIESPEVARSLNSDPWKLLSPLATILAVSSLLAFLCGIWILAFS